MLCCSPANFRRKRLASFPLSSENRFGRFGLIERGCQVPFRYETVSPVLLDVLRKLSDEACLKDFQLVGGTALALRLGHRRSVDIDLFCSEPFRPEPVAEAIRDAFAPAELETVHHTIRCLIRGVKVDMIEHRYRLLEPWESCDGLRVAGLKDLAAMKLNAIVNRGAKKDFWDIAALLDRFSLSEMFDFYGCKYPQGNAWTAQKSLCFFEDAEEDLPVDDLIGYTWEGVKSKIIAASRTAFGMLEN